MKGAPRCQECGSWNTVINDADYGTKVGDFLRKSRPGPLIFIALPFALIWANFDNMKTFACKDCKAEWHY